MPSLSTSASVTCDGCGMLAIDRQRAAGLVGMAGEHDALPHVGAEHVEPLVAVEIDQADVRHGRRAGHVAASSSCGA